MLYHYYMKINLKLLAVPLLALFCFSYAQAQVTVVKQDGEKVYLDTSEYNRAVAVGDGFKVILSQEQLINPKTGKDLGVVNHYSPEGKIIEVQAMYAIGEMPSKINLTIGQKVLIENVAIPQNSEVNTPVRTSVSSNRKMFSYNVLEREIVSATQANLTAGNAEEIAALDMNGNLLIYDVQNDVLQEIAQHKLPVGYKPITLSAKDIMGNDYAQLFVTLYKENEQKIYTFVFQVEEKSLKQIASLPYFVKEIGCGEEKEIYAQRPFIQKQLPGDAHKLTYEKNRFELSKDYFATRHNWLTGINRYFIQADNIENLIYTARTGHLRMQLKNHRFTESPALFATAPNRVKYKQDIISFYPSLQVYGPKGKATLAGIENTTKFGLLSEQFGQYNGGKIHFLTYENGSLALQETIPLKGFAYDTTCTNRGILIPQVLSSGQTVLTEIYR